MSASTFRPSRIASSLRAVLVLTVAALGATPLVATSLPGWPGLLGPLGTGHSPEAGVLPERGPLGVEEAWRIPLGMGYSSIVTGGERAYVLFSAGDDDVAAALDLESGREIWRVRLDERFPGHGGSTDGPIATPAVADGRLFVATPRAALLALDTATGRELWKVDLVASHSVQVPFYGYSSSPLVDGTKVIVQGGGESAPSVMAFDVATGEVLWQAGGPDLPNSYASPLIAELAGARQVVVFGGTNLIGIDPADGRVLWSRESLEDYPDRIVAVPGDRLLLPTWNQGVTMLRVVRREGGFAAEEIWTAPRVARSHGPAIYLDGAVYAFAGSILHCLDGDTGEVLWRHRTYDGSLISVDGRLILVGRRSGLIQVLEPNREAFRELARWEAFEAGSPSITPASAAAGLLLLRNLEEAVAMRVGGASQPSDTLAASSGTDSPAGELWRVRLESGLAPSGRGAAAAGSGRAYTTVSDGEWEYAIALTLAGEPSGGREIWRRRLDPTSEGASGGPESGPILSGDTLYLVTTACRLHALSADDGSPRWQLDLEEELGARSPSRGCQFSPAIAGKRLVVTLAGEESRLAALDAGSGKVLWINSEIDPPHYSTPVIAELGGRLQVLVHGWMRPEEGAYPVSTTYGLDLRDGTVLWSFSDEAGWSWESPHRVADNLVLHRTWDRGSVVQVEEAADGTWSVALRWQSSDAMDSPVVVDDLIFTASGTGMSCHRIEDGERLWNAPIGWSRIVPYGEALAVLSVEAPDVRLVAASGDGYEELGRTSVFNAGAVNDSPPVVAGRTLLLRNQEELVAVEWRH